MIKEVIVGIDGSNAILIDSPDVKIIKGDNFYHYFRKSDGYSIVCGKTQDDDPDYCEFGPLIADIEITTICKGPKNVPCNFCYKSNSSKGTYMPFETYKKLFEKLPKTIGQIAFGLDAQAESNPDTWKIFEHTRENGVVPNLTIADISDETADNIAKYAGACAVSLYDDKDLCYDCVKKLTDRGMTQVNIHFCLHSLNANRIYEIVNDIKFDPRLEKLNAIVFLSLKQKGRGINFKPLEFDKFKEIVEYVLEHEISFGFDSCGAGNFLKAVKDHPQYEVFKVICEPCESGLFSSYIDTLGHFFPCSFCENVVGWENGIDVVNCNNFITDVWNNDRVKDFRESLLANNRNCPIYNI